MLVRYLLNTLLLSAVALPPDANAKDPQVSAVRDDAVVIGEILERAHIQRIDLDRLTNRSAVSGTLAFLLNEPMQSKWFMQHVGRSFLKSLTPDANGRLGRRVCVQPEIAHPSPKSGALVPPKSLVGVIEVLTRLNDRAVRRALLGNPIEVETRQAATENALLEAVIRLHMRAGEPLSAVERNHLRSSLVDLPSSAQCMTALILNVARRAMHSQDRALAGIDDSLLSDPQKLAVLFDFDKQADTTKSRHVLSAFEVGHTFAATEELAIAVHAVARAADLVSPAGLFHWQWRTPYGLVVIDANNASDYAPDDYLLILDFKGDDIYHAGAGATYPVNPISVIIDVAGNDQYRSPQEPLESMLGDDASADRDRIPHQSILCAFGAGVGGIGLLVDTRGNDTYEVTDRGMGFGLLGAGICDDWQGRDRYKAIANSQGSSVAGLGLLVDRDGHDVYEAYTASQAFAFVRGVSALIDLAGDDCYEANDTDIRFPSSQSSEHNTSMCQGAASGHRADFKDGYSIDGGVAVLFDAKGNDSYSCGVFGQGVGYWLSAGFLIDASGNDHYSGQWYVQGAAAHFAIGAILDEAGDDNYKATMSTSLGTGHDLSVGFLADLSGNDEYCGPGLSTGAGNAAGVGLFIDVAGNDKYHTPSDHTLGFASRLSGIRETMSCVGLFIDAGGDDYYTQPFAQNNTLWGEGLNRADALRKDRRRALGIDGQLSDGQIERLWRRYHPQ